MARQQQQRFKGVRQRHWGSWTAEDAARAYDEAARLMCGPRAKTNFPYNPNFALQSSPNYKIVSSTLAAKLQKCHALAALKLSHATKNRAANATSNTSKTSATTTASYDSGRGKMGNSQMGCGSSGPEAVAVKEEVGWEQCGIQQLEDDHVEQMIEELLDYGYFELCDNQSQSQSQSS
ncbi:hypothetical protein V2J09_005380 [Rumex salicifolius]